MKGVKSYREKPKVKWVWLVLAIIQFVNAIFQSILFFSTGNMATLLVVALWAVAASFTSSLFIANVLDLKKYERWLKRQDKPVGRDVTVEYRHEWPEVKDKQ